MTKPLMEKLLKEVGDLGDRMYLGLPFTAGGGVINSGEDIFKSPDASQDEDSFAVNNGLNNQDQYKFVEPDSKTNTYTPSIAGSQTNISPIEIPNGNPQRSNHVPDETMPPQNVAALPPDVTDTEKEINTIKYKVTPDEIIAGIQAELHSAVFKRPDVAKALVIKNLKSDPKYYSKLKFLNIDDTLDEEFKGKTPQEIAIVKIVREMWTKKQKKRI
jgi:hypothetical protein